MPFAIAASCAAGLIIAVSTKGGASGVDARLATSAVGSLVAAKPAAGPLKLWTNASISPVAVPGSPNTASKAPTGYVSPGFATSLTKHPSISASTSFVILSVSISVSTALRAKGSPSETIQSAIVPSLISMPHLGIVNALRLAMCLAPIETRACDGPQLRYRPGMVAMPFQARAQTGPGCAVLSPFRSAP